MGKHGTFERVLRILMMVQGERGLTRGALADQLGVAARTIDRDIRRLKDSGVPIESEGEGDDAGYVIRSGFFLPPLDLEPDEASALLVLGEHVESIDAIGLSDSAGKALRKLRSILPLPLQDDLEELDGRLHVHPARTATDAVQDVWSDVSDAITARRALDCEYDPQNSPDPDHHRERFRFDPYALLFSQRAWYVVGHHHGRDALRTLRLARFLFAKPTDQPYVIPEDFSTASYLGNAWRMIRGADTHEVVLRFDASFAETVESTFWHATQRTEVLDDGTLRMRVTVDGLDEIVWWVLGYGPHVEVEAPDELRARVVDLARRTLARYGAGD